MLNSILDPIARPIAWVLAAFYSVIPNYGVAIIGLSILWMLIIAPLTLKSTRSMLAMQALQPEIKRLQEKHRNDRQALTQATMDLYKERNVSPFSSCLPSILPLPVFIALFRVIDGLSHKHNGVAAPQYLDHHTAMYKSIVSAHGTIHAFGLNLADNAFSHHSSALAAIPFFVLLLIMIGTSYLQTAMMMNRNPAASQNPQMKMMKYLPIVFGIICARFPAGVVLYYAVSNICRIIQQYSMYRWDPKVKTLVSEEVREVEARTHDIDESQRPTTGGKGKGTPPAKRQGFREMLAEARDQAGQGRAPQNRPQKSGGTKGGGAGGGAGGAGGGGAAAKPADRPGSVKANRDRQARRPERATGSNGSVKRSNKTSGKNPTGSKPVGGARSGNNGVAKGNGSGRPSGQSDGGAARAGASTSPRNRRRRRS